MPALITVPRSVLGPLRPHHPALLSMTTASCYNSAAEDRRQLDRKNDAPGDGGLVSLSESKTPNHTDAES